jgi:fluoroacetyl-CoA thioesterase
MRTSLFQGLTYTQTLDLDERTLTGHRGADRPIPTTFAVAFVEWACGEAVMPYLDAGERSIGTRIAFEHEAIAPVGQILAHVELVEIEGKRLRFKIVAQDATQVIGRGLHERLVVEESEMPRRQPRSAAADHFSAACM